MLHKRKYINGQYLHEKVIDLGVGNLDLNLGSVVGSMTLEKIT